MAGGRRIAFLSKRWKLRLTAETVQEMEKRAREIADAHEKIELSYGKWQQQSIEMASAAVSASKCL